MSLYGMLRTGGSGMNAQANRLGTVADNIANSNTTGYKKASTEFSSLILPATAGAYNSGGVETEVRYDIEREGSRSTSTSKSDLAISGKGFFVASGTDGQSYLTRAGAFTQDGDGNLVNSAGYSLMGYKYDSAADPNVVVNGFDGMTKINLASSGLSATMTTTASMGANLDSATATGATPSTTSLSVFDSQGNPRLLDFSYQKTADNTWHVTVTDRESKTEIGATDMVFDAKGALTSSAKFTTAAIGPFAGTGARLDGIALDMSKTTQLGYAFSPDGGKRDGNEPSKVAGFQIDADGVVYVKYENNTLDPRYRIALADVQSPNNLVPLSGNVYTAGTNSGAVNIGYPQSGQMGDIISGALESSNVDIAEELTSMIESQRNYTANSKVFQTGSDLLEVLVNLKR